MILMKKQRSVVKQKKKNVVPGLWTIQNIRMHGQIVLFKIYMLATIRIIGAAKRNEKLFIWNSLLNDELCQWFDFMIATYSKNSFLVQQMNYTRKKILWGITTCFGFISTNMWISIIKVQSYEEKSIDR